MDLSDQELEFYSRQIVLPDIGYSGQLKLKNARVCVVGLGGSGFSSSNTTSFHGSWTPSSS